MLGSRFDLIKTVDDIAERKTLALKEIDPPSDAGLDAPCVELEREIAAVARTLHSTRPRPNLKCPVCDSPMRISAEHTLSEFGALDVKLHQLECTTCGMLTGRMYHPSVGYQGAR